MGHLCKSYTETNVNRRVEIMNDKKNTSYPKEESECFISGKYKRYSCQAVQRCWLHFGTKTDGRFIRRRPVKRDQGCSFTRNPFKNPDHFQSA